MRAYTGGKGYVQQQHSNSGLYAFSLPRCCGRGQSIRQSVENLTQIAQTIERVLVVYTDTGNVFQGGARGE